jgi:pantothenate kinase
LYRIPSSSRLIVGISGIPASGKSTLAKQITEFTNVLLQQNWSEHRSQTQAILVGLDGWHLTRAQLDALPDPKLAHDRRGIHWTFDGEAYCSFVDVLRQSLPSRESKIITAPSFDHAKKDPVPDAISIFPFHRIVIIEGLYTLLSVDPWRKASALLDERWFLDIDFDTATERIIQRHVITGVAKDVDEAIWRARENDMPSGSIINPWIITDASPVDGRFITENMLKPTRVIQSIEEPSLS